MADWSLPTLSSLYTAFRQIISDRLDDAAKWFDSESVAATNIPAGTKRWNSSASKFEEWDGSSWDNLAETYGISISGNAITATTAATASNANNLGGSPKSYFQQALGFTPINKGGDTISNTTHVFVCNNIAIGNSLGSYDGLEFRGHASGGAAFITFNRPGSMGCYFGLDIDNQLKYGGLSLGNNSYKIWNENNDGAGSGLDADLLDGQHASAFAEAGHVHGNYVPVDAGWIGVGAFVARDTGSNITPGSVYTLDGWPGTYRCLGRTGTNYSGGLYYFSLFQRIA